MAGTPLECLFPIGIYWTSETLSAYKQGEGRLPGAF